MLWHTSVPVCVPQNIQSLQMQVVRADDVGLYRCAEMWCVGYAVTARTGHRVDDMRTNVVSFRSMDARRRSGIGHVGWMGLSGIWRVHIATFLCELFFVALRDDLRKIMLRRHATVWFLCCKTFCFIPGRRHFRQLP